MEHAPLRPVPSRPSGPVDPEAAERRLRAALPGLGDAGTRALALVALAGRPRAEAAAAIGLAPAELAVELAAARKELRRSLEPLQASGWCERAETLISDRLDGALDTTGAARLDAHLRNCARCVEHERRLVQATDGLLAEVAGPARPRPLPEPPVALPEPEPPAELPAGGEPAEVEPTPELPAGGEPAEVEPPVELPAGGEPAEVEATAEPPAGGEPAEVEPTPVEPTPVAPAEVEPARAEALDRAGESETAAPEAPPVVAPRGWRLVVTAATWHVLFLIAVLLAVASIALTIAGVLGAEL